MKQLHEGRKGAQSKFITSGIMILILFSLAACGIFGIGKTDTGITCPKIVNTSNGQLCGLAIRLILGPADEIEDRVPLDGSELFVLPVELIPHDEGKSLEADPDLICSTLKEDPASKEVVVDSNGRFSELFEPGEYILCVSYAPPWAPSVHSLQMTTISISENMSTEISITFSPMGGLFIQPKP